MTMVVLLVCCFVSAACAETAAGTVLCDTVYFKMLKPSITAETLVQDGDEAIMAGFLYLEVDRYYSGKSSDPLSRLHTPVLSLLDDRMVYAGLDQDNNGLAAFPCFGGSHYVYSWQGDSIVEIGTYPSEEIQGVTGTWKVCKEVDSAYFSGTIEGLQDALGISR